jgi:serine/threonine-protein kinase
MDPAAERLFRERQRVGRYRLLARLGTGGMAEVFLGLLEGGPTGASRFVAIKRMRPELTTNPEFVGLFLEEARTASMLTHPNVCQIHELTSVDGYYFMVMEYLEGIPLSGIMIQSFKDPASFGVPFVAGIIGQACEGIHYAHELCDPDGAPYHIVHRDLSPPNLFVTSGGAVKVLDFGISKSKNSLVRTMTGQIRGKFSYMSPEQLKGEKLDRRSDVFSLGIVLFEMLASRRLFRRRNRLNIFHAIVRDPIPSVLEFRPDLTAEIGAVVDGALARERDQRFASARELGDALVRAAAPFGGPMPPHALAALVNTQFGSELASKRELLALGGDGQATNATRVPNHTLPPDAATMIGAPPFAGNNHDLPVPDWVDTGATTQALTAADLTAIDLAPAPELEEDDDI